MKITITFDELDLKDNLILTTINTLFKQKEAITSDFDNLEDLLPPHQQKPLKSTENSKKQGNKSKEERVTELKKYANGIWGKLTDAQKKSMKSFVAFYEKKIMQQDFNINIANQWQKWWERDKNNK